MLAATKFIMNWLLENKEWVFSGIGVIGILSVLKVINFFCKKLHPIKTIATPTKPNNNNQSEKTTKQTHTGNGDNVGGDKYETNLYYDRKSSPSVPQGSSAQTKKEFIDKSPYDLLALYEIKNLNPIQVDDVLNAYKEKWIKAEGKIINMIPGLSNGDQAGITLLADHNKKIDCRFSPEWKDGLLRLSMGSFLKVNGKIWSTQNHSQLYLIECEIL